MNLFTIDQFIHNKNSPNIVIYIYFISIVFPSNIVLDEIYINIIIPNNKSLHP